MSMSDGIQSSFYECHFHSVGLQVWLLYYYGSQVCEIHVCTSFIPCGPGKQSRAIMHIGGESKTGLWSQYSSRCSEWQGPQSLLPPMHRRPCYQFVSVSQAMGSDCQALGWRSESADPTREQEGRQLEVSRTTFLVSHCPSGFLGAGQPSVGSQGKACRACMSSLENVEGLLSWDD